MKFIIFILFLNFCSFLCDLPVHCIARNIEGAWIFHMMDPFPLHTDPQLYRCGHSQPDRNTDHIYHNFKSDFKENLKASIFIEMKMPNLVLNDKSDQIGNWTMIYDEGWEVRLEDYTFLAFSYYFKEDLIEPHDDDDEQTKGYASSCNKTFLGWFTKGRQRGCFFAEKVPITADEQEMTKKKLENMEEFAKRMREGGLRMEEGLRISEKGERVGHDEKLKASRKIVENPVFIPINKEKENKEEEGERKEEKLRPKEELERREIEGRREEEEIKVKDNDKDNKEDGNVVRKFKEKLRDYGLPNEYLLAEEQNEDDFFQFDYNFIEMVNEFRESSLWEAKAHDDFKNKTKKQMKNLIGLTPFKEFKFFNIKTDIQPQNEKGFSSEDSKSFLELQNKQKLFNNKKSFLFKNKAENSIFSLEDKDEERIDDSLKDLPKNFDWRNINNTNFDTPVEHQGKLTYPPLLIEHPPLLIEHFNYSSFFLYFYYPFVPTIFLYKSLIR